MLRLDNNLRQLYIFQTLQLYLFPWCRLVSSIRQSFPCGLQRSIPPPEPLQTLHCSPWLCFDSKHCALHATTTFRVTWWFVGYASARTREEIGTFITWRGSVDPPPLSILLPPAEV